MVRRPYKCPRCDVFMIGRLRIFPSDPEWCVVYCPRCGKVWFEHRI